MATEPKDLTPSAGFTAGADAGEEDIGAEASSIEPKVTADPGKTTSWGRGREQRSTDIPCFTAFRGMLTPSFMETP